jgi:adhesin transport system membrane fusion protein
MIMAQESQYYAESLRELSQRTMTNQGAVSTRQQESQRAQAALGQAERAYQLAVRELNTTRPLLKTGAVSEMDILRLERDVSNADGERKQAAAILRGSQASIGEAQSRTSEAAVSLKNQWRNELAEAQAQLVSLKKVFQAWQIELKPQIFVHRPMVSCRKFSLIPLVGL